MSTRREYTSPMRAERADETRKRIQAAAGRLFVTEGFAKTKVAMIAKEAGVSVQTIYAAFGSKAAIVSSMLELLEAQVDMASWADAMIAEPSPERQIEMLAASHRQLCERGADILRAAIQARGEPDVAALDEHGNATRRSGFQRLFNLWPEDGVLRAGLGADEAADRLALVSSVEQYLYAVDHLGWTGDQYERWLSETMKAQVLA